MPLGVTGFTCGQCHATNVQVEHLKPTSSSFAAKLRRLPSDSARHARHLGQDLLPGRLPRHRDRD